MGREPGRVMQGLPMRPMLLLALLAAPIASAPAGAAQPPWLVLPPTPTLPAPDRSGTLPVDGIRLWYAVFGTGKGDPVLLLHGGLANANYWGRQVPALARHHEVIVVDSRGHGRSSRDATPIGYALMAQDVVALMDALHVKRAAILGWSDGAITGLDLAMHHPDRVSRLFAFAANADPSGVKDVHDSPVFTAFIARAGQEYAALNPAPHGYAAFEADIERMWAGQPHFGAADLGAIRVPVWIADGDHDEAIKRSDTDFMASHIPDARELILPGVSHFAFIQNPGMFNEALDHFLSGA
jgi:pimeloyl-ACP methyl ester carboxylesterase